MANSASLVVDVSANTAGASLANIVTNDVIGGIKTLVTTLNESANQVEDMATSAAKLGITLQSFQALSFAARQSNVDIGLLETGMGFLERNIEKATDGSKKQIEMFDRLGLSAEYLKMLAPDKQFEQVADAIGHLSSQNEIVDLSKGLFGKGGLGLIPLFKENVSQLETEFKKLNITLTDSQKSAVDGFEKQKKSMEDTYSGFKMIVASDVSPAFLDILNGIAKTTNSMGSLQFVALSTAKTIVEAASAMVSAFDVVYSAITRITGALDVVKGIGQAIGHAAFNQFHTPTGEFTASYQGSAAQSISNAGKTNQEFAPEANRVQFGVDAMQGSLDRNSDILKTLDVDIQKLQTAANKVDKGGLLGGAVGEKSAAFGYLQSEASGQRFDVSTAPQNVQVNAQIDVKTSDNLLQVIDQRIDARVNNISRGNGR